MAAAADPAPVSAEANTYNLPRGEAIRKKLVLAFRAQRAQALAAVKPPVKDKDAGLPDAFPPLEPTALALGEQMTPLLTAHWDKGGKTLLGRLGLDPFAWKVTNPHTASKIKHAALAFCEATNKTTSIKLSKALAQTRQELLAGVVTNGESVEKLTKRVNGVFDEAEKWRARRIAQTEASRAVHAAADEAAVQSKMVAGWRWLLSADACPLCLTVGRRAEQVPLGQPFAFAGDNPVYSEVRQPPLHPHCNCTTVEILKPEFGGPADPKWAPPLNQPEPEAQDYPGGVKPTPRPRTAPTPVEHPTVYDRVDQPGGRPAPPGPPKPLPADLDVAYLRSLDLHQVEPSWHLPQGYSGKLSYGGVVVDEDGRVLLREPSNHYDGYVWTFPKGRIDKGEHPVDAGLREVKEEAGVDGAILGLVPGGHAGGSGRNYYFLMRAKTFDPSSVDSETASVRWATVAEARDLIAKTTNATGRARDLAVLDAAEAHLAKLRSDSSANDHLRPKPAPAPKPKPKPRPKPAAPKPKPTPKPKPALAGFPVDPDSLTVVRRLGGSTGAELVEDPATGKRYVRKRGNSPGHLREECLADGAYRALGLKVPEFRLYELPSGPVKLAEYLDGAKPLADVLKSDPKLADKALKQLRQGFAVDALMGNWDVVGATMDNVMVDPKGNAWRIDNGGSLRYRAQGALKTPDQWNDYPVELWSLRDASVNAQTAKVFGPLKITDLAAQAKAIDAKALKAAKLPADVAKVLEARLDQLKDVAGITDRLSADKFTADYLEGFTKHTVGIRKAGLSARMPAKMAPKAKGDVLVYDQDGRPWDHLRGKGSLVEGLSDYIETNGGKYATIKHWADQQGSDSWNDQPRAMKRYLAEARGGTFGDYWWKSSPQSCANDLKTFAGMAGGIGPYGTAVQAQHAFTYELLRRCEFPMKDAGRQTVRLMRTENIDVMRINNLKVGAKGVVIKRGVAESCSIYRRVTVYGTELTLQDVPLHRVVGTYWQERYPGYGHGAFLGDGENEFVAILEGVPFDYVP